MLTLEKKYKIETKELRGRPNFNFYKKFYSHEDNRKTILELYSKQTNESFLFFYVPYTNTNGIEDKGILDDINNLKGIVYIIGMFNFTSTIKVDEEIYELFLDIMRADSKKKFIATDFNVKQLSTIRMLGYALEYLGTKYLEDKILFFSTINKKMLDIIYNADWFRKNVNKISDNSYKKSVFKFSPKYKYENVYYFFAAYNRKKRFNLKKTSNGIVKNYLRPKIKANLV